MHSLEREQRRQEKILSVLWGPGTSASKRRKIPKGLKDDVWEKYNGKRYNGKCYVCEKPITSRNFDVGHNKAVTKGGKTRLSNLRPICRKCNSSMGTMSIERYKKKYYGKGKKTTKRKSKRKKEYVYVYDMLGHRKRVLKKDTKIITNPITGKKERVLKRVWSLIMGKKFKMCPYCGRKMRKVRVRKLMGGFTYEWKCSHCL